IRVDVANHVACDPPTASHHDALGFETIGLAVLSVSNPKKLGFPRFARVLYPDGGRTKSNTHRLLFAIQCIKVHAILPDGLHATRTLDGIRNHCLDDQANHARVPAGEHLPTSLW